MCRRFGQPGAVAKEDTIGSPYWLWRPGGSPYRRAVLESRPSVTRAPVEVLDRAYRQLLDHLPLHHDHRGALRRRGLDDEAISRNAYRSMPGPERVRIARELAELFGEVLLSVPGFHLTSRPGRAPFASIAGSGPGIVIPCRDLAGRIVALKLRRDQADDGPRYHYLSSTLRGGPGTGSPAHAPVGTPQQCDTIRLTEGELKADVAYRLSGVATLSTAGVGAWRSLLPMLQTIRPRTVLVAWDADWQTKEEVRRPLAELLRLLLRCRIKVGVEWWPAGPKGIDDALSAVVRTEVRWMEGGRS